VKRTRGREDRRQVLVSLQPRGEKLLEKVVAQRLVELRSHGRALVESIGKLLESRTISGRQKQWKERVIDSKT
jgi:DNA-binding MarR family transcriptional regulator